MLQELTGLWKLLPDPDNRGRSQAWFQSPRPEAQDAPVPGTVQQVFPNHHGVSWYWHRFRPAMKADRNHRLLLRFGAVHYLAEVWLNGAVVGGHEGGESPFALDVTDAVRTGEENLLAVRVVNLSRTVEIDGMRQVETPSGFGRLHGGIIHPVELLEVPVVRIDDVHVQPRPATGEIDVTIRVVNDAGTAFRGRLTGCAGPAKTGEIAVFAETEAEFPTGESTHRFTLTIEQHRLWSLDDPYLYRVIVDLEACRGDGVGIRHQKSVRCGFRDFRVINGYFHLNGKRVFLRSMHTGALFPAGGCSPVSAPTPGMPRRDLILAKACGFNMVRFLAGAALPEQLDCCDEIGLMIYEESMASWGLEDSPQMAERYDRSLCEMIVRDRNHPCITIWGLLNETPDGPVFRHAVESLKLVRSLDDSRLVILGSGRWDGQLDIGSLSNPQSREWECQWGAEGPGATASAAAWDMNHGGYFHGVGDAHVYPAAPHPPFTVDFLRTLGRDTNPVFLSEYGIGSASNVFRELRHYEQAGMRSDLAWAVTYRDIAEGFTADWKRFGMDGVYPFPEDMLRESQRLHCRQRLLGFDLIRSNPTICGFNLTGMLDHPSGGEGVWTFWRELKPGIADALSDGWAALRWCLFVDPLYGYSGRKVKLEAVLANEDVLAPGDYPVTLRVHGPAGVAWEKKTTVRIPQAGPDGDTPLAVPVLCQRVKLSGPAGRYTFAANLECGGAPFGGRLEFRLSDPAGLPAVKPTVRLWGVDKNVQDWFASCGVRCKPFGKSTLKKREVIVVGKNGELRGDAAGWRNLVAQIARGSWAIFLSPLVFRQKLGGAKIGELHRIGRFLTSIRDFEVPNVPKREWEVFSKEFYHNVHYLMSGLPSGEYVVELGMCEGHLPQPDTRVFDVRINGRIVLRDFDLVKAAGGFQRAAIREFKVRPSRGKIEIDFLPKVGMPSISRLRIFDPKGSLIAEDTALSETKSTLTWLPLANKGRYYEFADWLYHKECVAKRHPVFDGLQAPGIMDWDYYGPVISRGLFEGQDEPEEVIAAAFAVGHICPGGYASGMMISQHALGAGCFLLNTFNILENLSVHPAADRLLLNMINHAATFAKGLAARLPKDFEATLKRIGYLETSTGVALATRQT